MIHIVFQEADIQTLQKAIELEDGLKGPVEIIRDDFAVGPLKDIDTAEGWEARMAWWKNLLEQSPYPQELVGSFDDRQTVETLQAKLEQDPAEIVWIWMGQNQHDVCSYYWLVSQLKDLQGRIFVIYLNNLPFINEKGNIFYPTTLHQILPKEFLKARKLNRVITPSEFEVDPDEWKKLCAENAGIRILEGGKKIASQPDDFYDKDILTGLSKEWQKGNRAMNNILGKMKIATGDVFLLHRMKMLAEDGKIEINGDPSKSWKDFEVRIKSNAAEETPIVATTE